MQPESRSQNQTQSNTHPPAIVSPHARNVLHSSTVLNVTSNSAHHVSSVYQQINQMEQNIQQSNKVGSERAHPSHNVINAQSPQPIMTPHRMRQIVPINEPVSSITPQNLAQNSRIQKHNLISDQNMAGGRLQHTRTHSIIDSTSGISPQYTEKISVLMDSIQQNHSKSNNTQQNAQNSKVIPHNYIYLRNTSQQAKNQVNPQSHKLTDTQLQGSAAQAAKYQRVKKKIKNDALSADTSNVNLQAFNDSRDPERKSPKKQSFQSLQQPLYYSSETPEVIQQAQNIYQLPFQRNQQIQEPIKVPNQNFPQILRNTLQQDKQATSPQHLAAEQAALTAAHQQVQTANKVRQTMRQSFVTHQQPLKTTKRNDVLLPNLNITDHLVSAGLAHQFYKIHQPQAIPTTSQSLQPSFQQQQLAVPQVSFQQATKFQGSIQNNTKNTQQSGPQGSTVTVVRLSSTLSEATQGDLTNSPNIKVVKQRAPAGLQYSNGTLKVPGQIESMTLANTGLQNSHVLHTAPRAIQHEDQLFPKHDSMLSAMERLNQTQSKLGSSGGTLQVKSPNKRKNSERQGAAEIEKHLPAEYQQMIQDQVIGQISLAPPIAPLFPVQPQMSRMVKSPKPMPKKQPFLKTNNPIASTANPAQQSQQVSLVSPQPQKSQQLGAVAQLSGEKQPPSASQSPTKLAEEKPLESRVLFKQGQIQKHPIVSPCLSQGYTSRKTISQMTYRKYMEGLSTRILVAKETLHNKKRIQLPILIFNLDGVIGYFDEHKTYYLRSAALNHLVALSANYRVVAFCVGQTKRCVKKLCTMLAERDHSRLQICFDAVYVLKKAAKERINVTHALLDFYDEELELQEFCQRSVVILTPEKWLYKSQDVSTMDMRELFVIDSVHFQGPKTPLIVRVNHARLRAHNCVSIDLTYQLLVALLVLSKETYNDALVTDPAENRLELDDPDFESLKITMDLLPQKGRSIGQHLESTHSQKFIMRQPVKPTDFQKGFQKVLDLTTKLDWLHAQVIDFDQPVPLITQTAIQTQHVLKSAEQPTGKRFVQMHRMPDTVFHELMAFMQDNEKAQKQSRKFRANYWAVNQIDEEIIKLIDADGKQTSPDKLRKVVQIMKQRSLMPKVYQPIDDSESEEEVPKAVDSELEEYNPRIPQTRYSLIAIKPVNIPDTKPKDKLLKFECRSQNKNLMNYLLDQCCRKGQQMMFHTTQQQHLLGAQQFQIESQIQQLNLWIEAQKASGRFDEKFCYD